MLKRTPLQRKAPMARTEFSGVPGVVRMRLTLPSSTPLRMDDGKARADVPVQRKKKCRICKELCLPRRPMAPALCSAGCEHAFALQLVERAQRKAHKAKLEKLKPVSYWEKRAEAEVNRYVRLRDAHLGCASCDKPASWGGQWHASHFRSVGAASAIRYHLWNINKACSECNRYKSGNLSEYEPRLRARRGDERVDWLRNQNQITRYSVDYLKRLRDVFAKKANRLARRLERA